MNKNIILIAIFSFAFGCIIPSVIPYLMIASFVMPIIITSVIFLLPEKEHVKKVILSGGVAFLCIGFATGVYTSIIYSTSVLLLWSAMIYAVRICTKNAGVSRILISLFIILLHTTTFFSRPIISAAESIEQKTKLAEWFFQINPLCVMSATWFHSTKNPLERFDIVRAPLTYIWWIGSDIPFAIPSPLIASLIYLGIALALFTVKQFLSNKKPSL